MVCLTWFEGGGLWGLPGEGGGLWGLPGEGGGLWGLPGEVGRKEGRLKMGLVEVKGIVGGRTEREK